MSIVFRWQANPLQQAIASFVGGRGVARAERDAAENQFQAQQDLQFYNQLGAGLANIGRGVVGGLTYPLVRNSLQNSGIDPQLASLSAYTQSGLLNPGVSGPLISGIQNEQAFNRRADYPYSQETLQAIGEQAQGYISAAPNATAYDLGTVMPTDVMGGQPYPFKPPPGFAKMSPLEAGRTVMADYSRRQQLADESAAVFDRYQAQQMAQSFPQLAEGVLSGGLLMQDPTAMQKFRQDHSQVMSAQGDPSWQGDFPQLYQQHVRKWWPQLSQAKQAPPKLTPQQQFEQEKIPIQEGGKNVGFMTPKIDAKTGRKTGYDFYKLPKPQEADMPIMERWKQNTITVQGPDGKPITLQYDGNSFEPIKYISPEAGQLSESDKLEMKRKIASDVTARFKDDPDKWKKAYDFQIDMIGIEELGDVEPPKPPSTSPVRPTELNTVLQTAANLYPGDAAAQKSYVQSVTTGQGEIPPIPRSNKGKLDAIKQLHLWAVSMLPHDFLGQREALDAVGIARSTEILKQLGLEGLPDQALAGLIQKQTQGPVIEDGNVRVDEDLARLIAEGANDRKLRDAVKFWERDGTIIEGQRNAYHAAIQDGSLRGKLKPLVDAKSEPIKGVRYNITGKNGKKYTGEWDGEKWINIRGSE